MVDDKEEQANLRKEFQTLDTDNDGFLTVEEITAGFDSIKPLFKKVLGKPDKFEPDWAKVIAAIDVENAGFGFDAFITAASDREKLITTGNNLRDAFQILDKDNKGYISLLNLKERFGYVSEPDD